MRIETETPPLLLVHRDAGATEWGSVPVDGQREFELEIADRYELVIVCEQTGARRQIVATLYARTSHDEDELSGLCPDRPFVVSGTLVQSGAVAFGGALSISTATNRRFALPARAGTFDLFMLGASSGFQLETFGARRGLTVTGDLDLGVIDLAQETTQPLVPKAFTAANARAEEELSAVPRLIDGEDDFLILGAGDDGTAFLVPEASLSGSEHQLVEVSATVSHPQRDGLLSTARTFITTPAQASPVTLPELIGAPSITQQASRSLATWTTLPDYDQLVFSRFTSSADRSDRIHELRMSRSYADATDASGLALDFQAVPGFLPEWELAAGLEPGVSLAAEKGRRTEEGSTFSMASRPFVLTSAAAQ